jgi:MscS family membrane protein
MLWALLFALLCAAPARAESPSCANPRVAADSLLAWLQPERYDPVAAATCLELSPGQNGPQLAVKLKKVLDARGHWIPVPNLSTDPDYVDEDGQHRVELVGDDLPQAFLIKDGERWLWSGEVLEVTPRLYDETFSGISARLQLVLPPVKILGVHLWQAVYFVGLILAGVAVSLAVNLLLRRQVLGWVERLGLRFNRELFDRTRRPMSSLAVGLVIYAGLPDLQLSINPSRAFLFTAQLLISLSVVLIAVRWIDVLVGVFRDRALETESRMDDQLIPLIGQASKGAVIILGLVFVLQNMGVDVGSLIAGLGIGGLAFALAAQDTLSNVFGSLTIFTDRPFQIGDWVIVEGGVEGTVEEIGFRSTRIRAFTNSIITVPNSRMTSAHVENMGARRFRRVKTTLGLTYDTPPDKVQAMVEGVRAIIAANPATFKDSYEVHFRDFGPSSLDILVYCFLEVPTWHDELVERSRMFLEILRLAEHLGVSFAFPSQSLYVESTPQHPLGAHTAPDAATLRAQVTAFGPGGAMARPGGPQLVEHGYNAGAASERGESGK